MNVTIVGGGFGGVKTALELAKDKTIQVTLISDKKNFQYYPALYSTATGQSHRKSWAPLKEMFRHHPQVTIVTDKIVSVDPDVKQVVGESGTAYAYDTVVLSLGSVTTYFGIEGLDAYAYGIKSHNEIRKLQLHLFNEMSDGSDDEKNYVIIGAGPTGVELAGALGEYLHRLRQHFGIKKKQLKISLIEAAPQILPRMSAASSRAGLRRLQKLGVHVETGKKVERQTADSLIVNGRPLKTQTVIWTSGVATAPFYTDNEAVFKLNERGKVLVDEHMQAAPYIYVIGDNAATPYAGLAQTALHDAIYIARHLRGNPQPYKAKEQPSVVPIGNNWAVFEWHKLRFSGAIGGLMRTAADLVGYSDILPIGWALGAWRAGKQPELIIPDEVSEQ